MKNYGNKFSHTSKWLNLPKSAKSTLVIRSIKRGKILNPDQSEIVCITSFHNITFVNFLTDFLQHSFVLCTVFSYCRDLAIIFHSSLGLREALAKAWDGI